MYTAMRHVPLNDHAPKFESESESESEQKNTLVPRKCVEPVLGGKFRHTVQHSSDVRPVDSRLACVAYIFSVLWYIWQRCCH